LKPGIAKEPETDLEVKGFSYAGNYPQGVRKFAAESNPAASLGASHAFAR
jgi:hypothetical protein